MSKSKHINAVCVASMAVTLALTLLFLSVGPMVLTASASEPPYVSRLFDTGRVHMLDLVISDQNWRSMLDNATDKEYVSAHVVIDGEAFKNVAIRPKGGSSLLTVAMSDSHRFSFKIEFDHYDSANTYHGLDKLALNNLIQDNTCLKDYLAYDMMRYLGVKAPLASFVWVTVNGEDFGLYLAVEGVEEAFAQRSYGSKPGMLYKPDTENILLGGEEDAPDLRPQDSPAHQDTVVTLPPEPEDGRSRQGGADTAPEEQGGNDVSLPDGGADAPNTLDGDVALIYSGDDPDGYPNIFNHSALGEADEADKRRLIRSLKQLNAQENLSDVLDIDQVLRYFVAHNFVVNADSYTGTLLHNYYLREQDGKLSMVPWDYNLSFGGMYMRLAQVGSDATSYVNAPIDTPVSGGDMKGLPMISWIFSSEAYREAYHRVFDQFLSGYFESGHFSRELQRLVALLSPYVEKDPTAFCTFEEFQAGTQALEGFCQLRAESIRGQLEGSIPATIDGQEADPAALIDASAIDLEDMTKSIEIGGEGAEASGEGEAAILLPDGETGGKRF